jgi:hypothetical protein
MTNYILLFLLSLLYAMALYCLSLRYEIKYYQNNYEPIHNYALTEKQINKLKNLCHGDINGK